MTDNLVKSIRRMVGQSTSPGQRTLLEHAAIQAADEIERLRAAGDALLDRLNDWHNGAPYDLDAEAIKAWEEVRRD